MTPLYIAAGLLTRIPVPAHTAQPRQLGQALGYFPWVGLGLGCVMGALAHLSPWPAHVSACLVVTWLALVTGGLHLDGVADVFDALGGGRGEATRMLDIMRDSRIGAHGAAALILVLALKIVILGSLLTQGRLWPLIGCAIISRWAVIPLMVGVRLARPNGLGRAFAEHGRGWHIAVAAVPALAFLAVVGKAALWAALVAAGGMWLFGGWLFMRLGGLTGDVYGASIEIGEILFLLATL